MTHPDGLISSFSSVLAEISSDLAFEKDFIFWQNIAGSENNVQTFYL